MKKIDVRTGITFFACVLLPLIVGVISSLISGEAMSQFSEFNQPPLSPPGWLFPIAWTILYLMMGLASFYIYTAQPETVEGKKCRVNAITYYFVQLIFNFGWSIFFFRLQVHVFSFVWLCIMWFFILLTMYNSFKVSKIATFLLVPYILWCTFAGYLNIMIAILN
ncbi:MAG: tryptophan-rich sensory protein [Pseudobutyrivibrio sp.]|nr:tryptophan-rich sensory protein [Pseudobutyrivibrio sp.]